MRLQDHQKRMALMSMTEDETPFKPSRTQVIFKNAANVSLRGHTYDAKHLDKFLNSGFGERSLQVGDNTGAVGYPYSQSQTSGTARAGPGGGGGSQMMSYLISGTTNSIKPSVSFMSMNRKDYKQIKYTDEQDGPSPLQILGNEKAFKDKHPDRKTLFETEREEHMSRLEEQTASLMKTKEILYKNYRDIDVNSDPGVSMLTSPKQKRQEVEQMKQRLDEYNQFKKTHMQIGRRDRQIKGGWRHGITGIDNADSANTSIFYQDAKRAKDHSMNEKAVINNKRLETLKVGFGTSSQMPIGSDTFKRTKSLLQNKPETVVDINEKWKTKNVVVGSQAELDTHKRIYQFASNIDRTPEDGCMKKIKLERSLKLRKEDLRNRTFNVITNSEEPENNWLNSYGNQKETYYTSVAPKIATLHEEKVQISSQFNENDKKNDVMRVKNDYKPKMNVTHQSSVRYKFIPKDTLSLAH